MSLRLYNCTSVFALFRVLCFGPCMSLSLYFGAWGWVGGVGGQITVMLIPLCRLCCVICTLKWVGGWMGWDNSVLCCFFLI